LTEKKWFLLISLKRFEGIPMSVFTKTAVKRYFTQVTYLMEHGDTIWYITEATDADGRTNIVDINSHQNQWLQPTDSLYREIADAFLQHRH